MSATAIVNGFGLTLGVSLILAASGVNLGAAGGAGVGIVCFTVCRMVDDLRRPGA